MSDELKTNDIVEEVNETEVPEVETAETEELTDVDGAEAVTETDGSEEAVTEVGDAEELVSEDGSKKKAKKKGSGAFVINPKTGKKQLKKSLIALIAIVSAIAVFASAIAITLAVMAGRLKDSTLAGAPKGFGLSFRAGDEIYADYSDRFAEFETEIQAGMAEGATDEAKVKAAFIIYRIASMADYNAPEKAKYSTGGGRATGDLVLGEDKITVGGGMNMTSTYYTIGSDAKGNRYCAQEEYTQVPEGSVEASMKFLITAGEVTLPGFLGFARRGIVTPEKSITWNGDNDSGAITEESAVGKFKDQKNSYKILTAEEAKEAASKYARVYGEDWNDPYGGSAPDLSIHVINEKTIIPNSVVITQEEGADSLGRVVKYYKVAFEINPDVIVAQGVDEEGKPFDIHATWYAEQLYLANAGLDFLNALGNYSLRYDEMKVNMEVFENGYIRKWSTDETWIMSANITHELVVDAYGTAGATLTSENFSEEFYCYDHDIIMQGFVNRWIGGSKHVGMALEDLPFYNELKDYKAQEYGKYR